MRFVLKSKSIPPPMWCEYGTCKVSSVQEESLCSIWDCEGGKPSQRSYSTQEAILEELFGLSPTAGIADIIARKKTSQSARKEPYQNLDQEYSESIWPDYSKAKVVLKGHSDTRQSSVTQRRSVGRPKKITSNVVNQPSIR